MTAAAKYPLAGALDLVPHYRNEYADIFPRYGIWWAMHHKVAGIFMTTRKTFFQSFQTA